MNENLKKGMKEAGVAILYGVGIIVILAALYLLSGCAGTWERYPTEVRMFAAWDPDKGSARSPIGQQPTGHILITQPLPAHLELSLQHISSIPDFRDRGEMNALGVGFCVKVPLRDCR